MAGMELAAAGPAPPAPVGYDLLVLVHIVSVVVGAVGLALSSGYANALHRGDSRTRDSARPFFAAGPNRASYFLYAVPLTGMLVLLARNGSVSGGDLWLPASLGLWVAAAAVATAVIRPAEAELSALTASVNRDVHDERMRRSVVRLTTGTAVVDVLLAAAVPLMILKP